MNPQPITSRPTGGAARASRIAAARARPAVDLRGLVDPTIVTQGPRPLCVSLALSVGHEAARTHSGTSPEPLAPEAIWRYCTARGHTGPDGMVVDDAAAALTDDGQPSLADWPYNDRLGVNTEDPPGGAGAPPWHRAIVRRLHLAHDGVEDELEDLLAGGAPVLLLVEVTDEFVDPDETGYVTLPNLRAQAGDYHAVVCVGAATHPSRGRHLLIRNTWGEYWGVGGYCWLPVAYLIAFVPYAAIVQATAAQPHNA